METKLLRRSHYVLYLLVFLMACSGDPEPEKPFSDLNDFNTTDIESNIPRLEIDITGDKIKAYFSVTDQEGIPLENFNLQNYRIVEVVDGDSVNIVASLLSNASTDISEPLAVSANLDYSGSMSDFDIINMENAVKTFIRLKDNSDEISLVKFGSDAEKVQDFTTDTTELLNAVDEDIDLGGRTAFYDACDIGLEDLNGIQGMLPIVIGFTDGKNNSSFISENRLILKAKEYQIPIYTIGFGNADDNSLKEIAETTGGRYFYTPSSEDIELLYTTINHQLKRLYVFEWNISHSVGENVQVVIKVKYEAGNGVFEDVATSYYVVK